MRAKLHDIGFCMVETCVKSKNNVNFSVKERLRKLKMKIRGWENLAELQMDIVNMYKELISKGVNEECIF